MDSFPQLFFFFHICMFLSFFLFFVCFVFVFLACFFLGNNIHLIKKTSSGYYSLVLKNEVTVPTAANDSIEKARQGSED